MFDKSSKLFGVTYLSNLRDSAPFILGRFMHCFWTLDFGLGVLYQVGKYQPLATYGAVLEDIRVLVLGLLDGY